MTKPVVPTPPAGNNVVEMDAIDVKEWEHGQRTPQASDANLAALVKQSGESAAESAAHRVAPPAAPATAPSSLASGSSARPALPPLPEPVRRGGPAMGPLPGGRATTSPPAPLPGVRAGGSPVRAGTSPPALSGVRTSSSMSVPSLPGARGGGAGPDVASAPVAPPSAPPPDAVAPPAAAASSSGRIELSSRSADKPARPGSPNLPFVLRGNAPVLDEAPAKLAFRSGRPGSQPPAEVPAPHGAPALDETVVARRPASEPFEDLTARRPAWPGSRPLDAASFTGGPPTETAWIDQTAPGRPTALAARPGSVSFDEPTRVVRVSGAQPVVPTPPAAPESAQVSLPLPAPVESARPAYPTSAGSFNDVPSFVSSAQSLGDRRTPSRVVHPSVDRRVITETGTARSIAPSRRLLVWTGAGCVAVVAAIVLLGGGSTGSSATAVSSPPPAPRDNEYRAAAAAAAGPPAAAAAAEPAVDHADRPEPADHPDHAEPAAPAIAAPPGELPPATPKPTAPVNRARRLGGKKLVVEYNDRGSDAPSLVAQDAEDPAIPRARAAYVTGNRKLFAGDVKGAIAAYQESLALYPGYVGGYRGLGLAYAQLGERDQALAALQTYVATVPSAKDVALIKKRIARLQGK